MNLDLHVSTDLGTFCDLFGDNGVGFPPVPLLTEGTYVTLQFSLSSPVSRVEGGDRDNTFFGVKHSS